jgi:hypothetical protein
MVRANRGLLVHSRTDDPNQPVSSNTKEPNETLRDNGLEFSSLALR